MVDLQAHALPGADRGAPDDAAALAMCRYAAERGTRELVVAPTTDLSQPWDPAEADSAIERLQAALGETIHLHRGCEVKLNEANLAAVSSDPGRYTINGRQYLLLDASDDKVMRSSMADLIDRLREAGAVPVITAPERSPRLRGSPARLQRWFKHGALFQVCGASLTGLFGERVQREAIALVDSNLARFVASDGVDLADRPPDLLETWEFLVYRWSEAKAQELLIDNPWAALWGERIEAPHSRVRRRSSWSSRLFGRRSRSRH
ncbi:MAG: hypothetical protein GC160_07290 [Acidobacteria bacterium]|nr:hypothetical protein [Acidobacteriota bacterium]